MTVLAEGIETRGQLERLRHLGCELDQGYLFSPVVPTGEVPAMLDREPGSWEKRLALATPADPPLTRNGARALRTQRCCSSGSAGQQISTRTRSCFFREILPKLGTVKLCEIAEAAGLSKSEPGSCREVDAIRVVMGFARRASGSG